MTIKEKYKSVLNELARQFANITGKRGEWFDVELWATEYEAWSVPDMLYIVDNYARLLERYNPPVTGCYTKEEIQRELLVDDIEAWIDYNVDVASFGIKYINLKSWLAGCPRLSKEEIDNIKESKRKLDELIGGYKVQFGALDTDPQPQHLRELKDRHK